MRKRSELLISLIQIPVDYIMLVVSFTLAYFLRQGSGKPFSGIISGYAYFILVCMQTITGYHLLVIIRQGSIIVFCITTVKLYCDE